MIRLVGTHAYMPVLFGWLLGGRMLIIVHMCVHVWLLHWYACDFLVVDMIVHKYMCCCMCVCLCICIHVFII